MRSTLYDVVEQVCGLVRGQQLAQPGGRAAWDYLQADADSPTRRSDGFAWALRPMARAKTPAGHGGARVSARTSWLRPGLIKLPEGGGDPRDYFFNRVIFPISDSRGRVIAFGGTDSG